MFAVRVLAKIGFYAYYYSMLFWFILSCVSVVYWIITWCDISSNSTPPIPRRTNDLMMTSSNGNIFPRYWPFVRGIHRSPVNSPHKGQWHWALIFSMIYALINGWVNSRGDLRRHGAHHDVIIIWLAVTISDHGHTVGPEVLRHGLSGHCVRVAVRSASDPLDIRQWWHEVLTDICKHNLSLQKSLLYKIS